MPMEPAEMETAGGDPKDVLVTITRNKFREIRPFTRTDLFQNFHEPTVTLYKEINLEWSPVL